MSNREIYIDTHQLEKLSGVLAGFPKELNASIKLSLKGATLQGLKKAVTTYYALDKRKLKGTYRVVSGISNNKVAFEVYGRRLSPTHFNFFPKGAGTPRPFVEIIKGRNKRLDGYYTKNGKKITPFVMSTGSIRENKESVNIFSRNDIPNGGTYVRSFHTKDGGVSFLAKKKQLHTYRTVSVPQMLGNPEVSQSVSEEMLQYMEARLFDIIAARLGTSAQSITKV